MKKLILLCFLLIFSACEDKNEDGSKKDTYSSCKITSTNSVFSSDKINDLKQCWNFPGDGYTNKTDALNWCETKVLTYYKNRYVTGSVNAGGFGIESTYCPTNTSSYEHATYEPTKGSDPKTTSDLKPDPKPTPIQYSCKITTSNAKQKKDREYDMKQCWAIPSNIYDNTNKMEKWCKSAVKSYYGKKYILGYWYNGGKYETRARACE